MYQQMEQPYIGMSSGGLPALNNPMAQQLQSHGRGDDTMLIHMTPKEVGGLQALAMAHGGSLTINPHTGLPEAGFLSKLLPMIIGMGLNFIVPGVGSAIGSALGGIGSAAGTGLLVGAGATAITGDLRKGLMAGLGAFGGASLAGGIQGAIGGAAAPTTAATAAPVAGNVAGNVAAPVVGNAAGAGSTSLGMDSLVRAGGAAARQAAAGAGSAGLNTLGSITQAGGAAARQALTAPLIAPLSIPSSVSAYAPSVAGNVVKKGLPGFMQGFANTARGSMTGLAGKAAVPLAISGAYGGISNAFTPSGSGGKSSGAIDNSYQGPYTNEQRNVIAMPKVAELTDPAFSGERKFFDRSVPGVLNMQGQLVQPGSNTAPGTMLTVPMLNPKAKKGQPMYSFSQQPYMGQQEEEEQKQLGYADGGPVHMSAGSFVMPARETAEFGKGSTDAGQRVLSGLGGIPIRGRGNGISDDIRASIGGQQARVANGEVHFPPEAVRRLGKGSEKRGTKKLYALMKRAEQSRKQAVRGGKGLNIAKGLRAV
jgi:hypothetical protein